MSICVGLVLPLPTDSDPTSFGEWVGRLHAVGVYLSRAEMRLESNPSH
jgi:hypothetical protein